MKKLLFILLFFGYTIISSAQTTPNVGDELVIQQTNTSSFNYVKFPKENILIKRGKIGNYKNVFGNHVIVDEVITKEDGSTYVMFKKKDGTKFFGFLSTVKANYSKALEAKEIMKVKS